MDNNYTELVNLAVSILVIVASIALNALKNYLATKTDSDALRLAESKAIDYIVTRVRANKDNAAKIIMAKLADNKITKDEALAALKELGSLAISDTKANLGKTVVDTIGKHYGDVDAYLRDKLEMVVSDVKKQ